MNKITPKDYAMGLFESIKGKMENEITIVIDNFIATLAKNNDLSKVSKIIDAFSRLWNKESGIVESEIAVAKKLDRDSLNLLKDFLLKLSGAKEAVVKEIIDESILGGAVIRYEDKVFDFSLKTKIKNLNNLIKA